ncbi:hypothetical protein GCM10023339_40230 [Alloalcanivorax gelatiniphagus]
MRVFSLPIVVSIAAYVAVVGSASPASARADRDCGDFASQQAAQLFFLNNNPAADPHGLDSDGDGVVCESNPGPSYYGSNPNPGGNDNPPPKPPKAKPAPIKVVKVIKGDLVRLRQGAAKPYDVRLLGLRVRGNACMTGGARDYLATVAKPGRVVTVITDKKAPKRDGQGHLIAEVRPKSGDAKSGFARKVVTEGWAKLQGYKFTARSVFRDLMVTADDERVGLFGECIKNYGSPRYPYAPGKTFLVDGWILTFGATDLDALPEMTAEAAAANATVPGSYSFAPPKPGATFRRVQVTAHRVDGPSKLAYGYVYGDTLEETTVDKYGSCGTAPNLLDQMKVDPGQTVAGYLCTAKPAADGSVDEMWAIADPRTYLAKRFIAIS